MYNIYEIIYTLTAQQVLFIEALLFREDDSGTAYEIRLFSYAWQNASI